MGVEFHCRPYRQYPEKIKAAGIVPIAYGSADWTDATTFEVVVYGMDIDLFRKALVLKGVTLQGNFSHNWPIWERVIRLLSSGRLNLGPEFSLISPLTGWHDAFEAMHSGEIVKAVLLPAQ